MSLNHIPFILLLLFLITTGVCTSESPMTSPVLSSLVQVDPGNESVKIANSDREVPESSGSGIIEVGPLNPEFIKYQESLNQAAVHETGSEHGLGDVPSPVYYPEVTDIPMDDLAVQELRTTFDLREKGKVSAVRDQNGWGTCWAFATFGSLESYLLPEVNQTFSPKNMVNRDGFDGNENTGGGIFMSTATLTRWDGPVDEATDPYPIHNWTGSAAYPPVFHVQDVIVYPARTNRTDTRNIKAGLQRWGAAYVSIFWSDDFFNSSSSGYYMPETSPNTNGSGHGVTLVGWNDTFPASAFNKTPAGDGAWIVKNSWGPAWGDEGFFYVSYYDKYLGSAIGPDGSSRSTAFFTAEPVTNYAQVYQHDPLGECESVRFGTLMGGTFANRFTATSPGTLSAIGFYTTDQNTRYEAAICLNPTDGPVGEMVAWVNGTLPMMGYHTVALPVENRVPISAGDTFSVILTLTNLVNPRFAAIEMPIEDYSSNATSQPGESYFTIDNGSTFIDLATQLPDSNFCIKAYVLPGPAPKPERLKASFAATPVKGQAPLTVKFTDTSTGSPGMWFWSFGDGTQSVIQNPVKTFTEPGLYSPTLVVRKDDQRDSISKRNYITVQNSSE